MSENAALHGDPVLVGGRYELVELLGSGAMGAVFAAYDLTEDRVVALKRLHAHRADDEVARARFEAEARCLGRWDHPGLPHLYTRGEEVHGPAVQPYLVMRMVLGEPLSEVLAATPALAVPRALDIVSQLAETLAIVHSEGVVHRDVKPGNIVIARSGRPVLIDFGIAAADEEEPLTATGELVGSTDYVSPEQVLGRRATPASDIYALGVLLFRLLTGTRPFQRDSMVASALAHVNDPVPTLDAPVAPVVVDLVHRMLAKDPDDRPAAMEVSDTLLVEAATLYTRLEERPRLRLV